MSRIAESTVRRLSHYYRLLEEVAAEGKRMISSNTLADREGITSAQVRKDLSYFGSFGRRGLGYSVEHLRAEIRGILGLDRRWRVAVVGAGHIGSALIAYRGFAEQGFDVVAVYDRDPGVVGRPIGSLTVRDVSQFASDGPFDLGVVATPLRSAQEVVDLFVKAGVRGILNFAPRKLRVPDGIVLRTVDMTVEFESLSFALSQPGTTRRRRGRA